MGHLPKRGLWDILAQRQRVLRGRDLTWRERIAERVDWGGIGRAALMTAFGLFALVELFFLVMVAWSAFS